MNCRDCGKEILPYGQNLKRIFDVGYEYVKTTCEECAKKKKMN